MCWAARPVRPAGRASPCWPERARCAAVCRALDLHSADCRSQSCAGPGPGPGPCCGLRAFCGGSGFPFPPLSRRDAQSLHCRRHRSIHQYTLAPSLLSSSYPVVVRLGDLPTPSYLSPPWYLRLRAVAAIFCCPSSSEFRPLPVSAIEGVAILGDEEIVSRDDEPKPRRGQRGKGAAGLLRESEAEAVQVGRRAAVALLLLFFPGARGRPAPELLRRRPAAAAVSVAEGEALVEHRGRHRSARSGGGGAGGRRGGDQEDGLRAGIRGAAVEEPLAAGHRHGDDAGREQGGVEGEHPSRHPAAGGRPVAGAVRDGKALERTPRVAAPAGRDGGRQIATPVPNGGWRRRHRRRGAGRSCDDHRRRHGGRVAGHGVGRGRARQAHGKVPARGDEDTGLGEPAAAEGRAGDEDDRGQGGEDDAAGAGEDGEQAGVGAGGGQGEARGGGGQAEPPRRAGRGQGRRAAPDRPPAVLLRVLAQAAAAVRLAERARPAGHVPRAPAALAGLARSCLDIRGRPIERRRGMHVCLVVWWWLYTSV